MWETAVITSTESSLQISVILWSRTRPNGSGSSSNVRQVVPHSLKSLGSVSAGWPRITNNREFNRRKLESRSSRHCKRNLSKINLVKFFVLIFHLYMCVQQRQIVTVCWINVSEQGHIIIINYFYSNKKKMNECVITDFLEKSLVFCLSFLLEWKRKERYCIRKENVIQSIWMSLTSICLSLHWMYQQTMDQLWRHIGMSWHFSILHVMLDCHEVLSHV